METRINTCLVCNSDNLSALKGYEFHGLAYCSSCGMVFHRHVVPEEILQKHYTAYPESDLPSDVTVKRYNEILDRLEHQRKNNTILDVGCGEGYFLEEALKRGWDAYGTEYAERYVKNCSDKGIKMRSGKLQVQDFKDLKFDVICSFEVIEHIQNPQEEIRIFNKLLRDGGIVYLTTPNFNSISRNLLGEKWNIISVPDHLAYYTPKTLTRLFKECGFRKLQIKTEGISISRLKSSVSKSENVFSGTAGISEDRRIQEKAENSLLWKLAKSTINGILNLSGKGDNLKSYFIKA
ncbi:MAG: class I SAM-dependent methyltransferase [Bacteroidetes bacterium]|nr:MAG: class I SAM-dependent methyltransferase [Bacteroidota bacterium]REJ99705.1 MAG: class I SAM-dependent methyltransferase [Bacteroidota bacterium]REK33938.1 MAG: class I SAM-dependent methyltransferase [Bacteroidota bacterium]REK47704.1 MAG: class I SAM-dependent methyltransferase [Bacteroidota bacterium]